MVLEGSGETTVVAEDLGVVPDYVPPTLQKLGIPGFRIPTLFRDPDGAYSDPNKYPRLSLAQPTTHDHPPLAAAWAECWQNIDAGKDVETNRRELHLMLEFAGLQIRSRRANSLTSSTRPSLALCCARRHGWRYSRSPTSSP